MAWHYDDMEYPEDDFDLEHELFWDSLIASADESWDREDAMIEQGAARTDDR